MSYEDMEQQDDRIREAANKRIEELERTCERVCNAHHKVIEECDMLRAELEQNKNYVITNFGEAAWVNIDHERFKAREYMRDAAVKALDDLEKGNQLNVLRFYTYQTCKATYLALTITSPPKVLISWFKESGKYYDQKIIELTPEQVTNETWYDTMMALLKEHCTRPEYHYVIEPQGDFGYPIMRPVR